MRHNFKDAARDAHAGSVGFDEFARRTSGRWKWWAGKFAKDYKLPAWFGMADVEQELLISAWQAFERFDPARGIEPARYVEWNAVRKATKTLSKARGVEQHRRKGPGRPEVLECTLAYGLPETAEEKSEVDGRWEKYEIVALLGQTENERLALQALANEGSAEAAGSAIYADPAIRLACELGCERAAVRFVTRAIDSVATRFGHKEALI